MDASKDIGAKKTQPAVATPSVDSKPDSPVSREAIRAELEKALSSPSFLAAKAQAEFLRFCVEETLEGRANRLKEYLLGVEVFRRGPSFDPRLDSIVRVEARRLRAKLVQYYQSEGRNDPVRIEFSKGSYVPVFRSTLGSARAGESKSVRSPRQVKLIALLAAVSVVAAAAIGIWVSRKKPLPRASAEPRAFSSIAVLPFLNLSEEKGNEYFSDGLTEELITALAKVPDLRVVARTTAFQFKGKPSDIRKIGAELNVSMVLEGSVRRTGNRLRITTQLNDTANGFHLWSETYEREMKDVFAIQEEISLAIVDQLKGRLTGSETQKLVRRYTANLEAYDLYLKGLYVAGEGSRSWIEKSIDYFEKAAAVDSTYAPAYARMAMSHVWLGLRAMRPPREVMGKAESAALKAVALDERLADGHAALAAVRALYSWDWPAAEREFQRALQLNPGSADIHYWYAYYYLLPTGHSQEALAEVDRALSLDPLSHVVNGVYASILYFSGQYDEAIQRARRCLELEPHYFPAYLYMGWSYEQKGDFPRAIRSLETARDLSGGSTMAVRSLARTHALSGNRAEALKLLNQLQEQSQKRYIAADNIAFLYATFGDKERAFEWLQKALKERSTQLAYMKVGRVYDTLRPDPRYAVLLKELGLDR